MNLKADARQLQPYLRCGWQLIPLHKFDKTDTIKGKIRERGKSPLHKNWTRRVYKSADQVPHMEAGNNVGVRLGAEDLVIDIDPRNFNDGDNPWARLCEDVGLEPSDYPQVMTGSGGLHIYMKKPADISVRDSLPGYEGVEFKTLGRQVVSAGSIHPTTKKLYEWDVLTPDLDEAEAAPRLLLDLIRRPQMAATTGGGEHTQEELATMLEALDPEDFKEHDAWLSLMQACHHATAGDGRAEFVEWSTMDPDYHDHGGLIGRRWDSLHVDNEGAARVTYRTLHKLLRDAGREDAIPRAPAEDDFEEVDKRDVEHFDVGPEHEKKGPLERMNDKFWAVMDGASFRVMWQQEDPSQDPPRSHWVRAKPYDFHQMLANKKVQSGDKTVQISEAWLEWGGRRSAKGVIFDPEKNHEGFLNLWTGWGVTPIKKEGGWSLLNDLLFEALCDGDQEVYDYVLKWSAYMVQHPGQPAEVAICFQGQKGTGKGTWFRALTMLAGRHGMQITSSEHLTGRFNDHLRDVIFLFADEALKPYDKDGESRLKGLITEPTLTYEGKGKDAKPDRNRLHVGMASNEDWFVPMGLDGERRFLLQRANTKWQGDTAKFDALYAQLRNGGLEALLWDLLDRDLGDWSPRDNIPATAASIDQKLRNMPVVAQWWFNILQEGTFDFDYVTEKFDWYWEPIRIFKDHVRASFNEHCAKNGIRHAGAMSRSLDMMFASEIKKLVPGLNTKCKDKLPEDVYDVKPHNDGRAWTFEFPPLDECRAEMEKILGGKIDWGVN